MPQIRFQNGWLSQQLVFSRKIVLGFLVLTFLIAGNSAAGQKVQNPPPRRLAAENASEGLFPGMNHLFTIPDYWDYGNFKPQECVELPGKLFRAMAHGQQCRQVFLISGHEKWSPDQPRVTLSRGRLYAAWRVKDPNRVTPGGRYSCVHPGSTTWQIWLEKRSPNTSVWHVQRTKDGKMHDDTILTPPRSDAWHEVRLALEPTALELEINSTTPVRFEHDAYPERLQMHFGSVQPDSSGPAVVSEFRYVFFDRFPYPYSSADSMPEGPEDINPADQMVRLRVAAATPESPRHSEGDVIALKDGSLLLIWTDYFQGKGWDKSPARLSGKVSRDGGRSWSAAKTLVDFDPDSPGGNVMSVSLLRASNGDILLAYHDQTREMKAKGMVLRRSSDEGKTWSGRHPITPNTGNVHAANNAGFRKLRSGRIVLACREYVDGTRWPYALYSDDDGSTWKAGRRVPQPDLSPAQVKAQNVNEPSIAELPAGRLIMMMRSVAGGHFFSYSSDGGESWSKPELSPLRGIVAPPYIGTVPSTGDLLAIWSYGLTARTPLNSAISKDGGKTWSPVKLLEQSKNFGYGYTSVNFVNDRVLLTTSHYPLFSSLERFAAEPGYIDLLLVSLPLEWFYRIPK